MLICVSLIMVAFQLLLFHVVNLQGYRRWKRRDQCSVQNIKEQVLTVQGELLLSILVTEKS
jgi:hypothetical protein